MKNREFILKETFLLATASSMLKLPIVVKKRVTESDVKLFFSIGAFKREKLLTLLFGALII